MEDFQFSNSYQWAHMVYALAEHGTKLEKVISHCWAPQGKQQVRTKFSSESRFYFQGLQAGSLARLRRCRWVSSHRFTGMAPYFCTNKSRYSRGGSPEIKPAERPWWEQPDKSVLCPKQLTSAQILRQLMTVPEIQLNICRQNSLKYQ